MGVFLPIPRYARFLVTASILTVDIRQFEQFLIAIARELQELKKFGVNVGNFVFPFSFICIQSDLLSMNITSVKAYGSLRFGAPFIG